MVDETEEFRRAMIASGQPQRDLSQTDGPTWTTDELGKEFDVLAFIAPFVIVRRKSDGANGSMEFTHSPRVYFNFVDDREADELKAHLARD